MSLKDDLLAAPNDAARAVVLDAALLRLTARVVTDSGANHDLAAAEAGAYLRMTKASGAKTVTVRLEATEALPENGEWHVRNAAAAGDVTLTPIAGVTLNAPAGGTLVLEPGMTVTVKRVAVNVFDVIGQTVAA